MNTDAIGYDKITQRNHGVYSQTEQEMLACANVTVIGVGCDGGQAIIQLARTGVGRKEFGSLRGIDFDTNEPTNLNRQPMATISAMGLKKVYAAEQIISDINPHTNFIPLDAAINEHNAYSLVEGSDVILQCTDSMVARIITVRTAQEMGIPCVVMTGQPPFRSIASVIMSDGPNYESLFGIDFVVGKRFCDTLGLEEKVHQLKLDRARHAYEWTAQMAEKYPEMRPQFEAMREWYKKFERYARVSEGEPAWWPITTERAYVTANNMVRLAIDHLADRKPKAVAPKAYVYDDNGLEEFGLAREVTQAIIDCSDTSKIPSGRKLYELF